MTDLFKATHCDRCKKELNRGRKMSWFTEETNHESINENQITSRTYIGSHRLPRCRKNSRCK